MTRHRIGLATTRKPAASTEPQTITLNDRTIAVTGRRRLQGKIGKVKLAQKAVTRVLTEIESEVHEAHTLGRETELILRFRPEHSGPGVGLVVTRNAPRRPDALDRELAEARVRGAQRVAEILADPVMLSSDDFARRMNMTRENVRQMHLQRKVLGLVGAKRGIRYPEWQLGADGKPIPELPELFKRLGDDPWAVYRFLLEDRPELDGENPLKLLFKGQGPNVLAAADTVGETFS